MLAADFLHEGNQHGSTLYQPIQRLSEWVEPGTFTVLVARKGFRKMTILLLGQGKELDGVGWRRIVGHREQDAGIGLF